MKDIDPISRKAQLSKWLKGSELNEQRLKNKRDKKFWTLLLEGILKNPPKRMRNRVLRRTYKCN